MIFLKIITVIISPFLMLGACWLGCTLGIKMASRINIDDTEKPPAEREEQEPTQGPNLDAEFWESFKNTIESIINAVVDFAEKVESYPNKRVLHLAKYAKKRRVRKKNVKRIIEWIEEGP